MVTYNTLHYIHRSPAVHPTPLACSHIAPAITAPSLCLRGQTESCLTCGACGSPAKVPLPHAPQSSDAATPYVGGKLTTLQISLCAHELQLLLPTFLR